MVPSIDRNRLPIDRRIRVLHVDDQLDFAEMTADFLEREDDRIQVRTVPSPEEVLDQLDNIDVDCIVSDYDMSGINGLEFLRKVRTRRPNLPFILFTGKGSEDVASEAITLGVTDYLQKEAGTGQYPILANRIKNAVERSRAKEAIEFERSRRSPLFEHSPDPIIEVEYEGDEARVTAVNPAFETTFGVTESDIVTEDILEAFSEEFTPEEERADLESIKERVREGQSVIKEVTRFSRGREREFLLRIFPFQLGEGVRRAYGWYVDVSEQKAAERRFREIFERSNEAILVVDPHADTILEANEAASELLGYQRSELLALSPEEIHPHEIDRFRDFVDSVEREGSGWTDELSCLTKQRERVPVEVSASILEPESAREMLAMIRGRADPSAGP